MLVAIEKKITEKELVEIEPPAYFEHRKDFYCINEDSLMQIRDDQITIWRRGNIYFDSHLREAIGYHQITETEFMIEYERIINSFHLITKSVTRMNSYAVHSFDFPVSTDFLSQPASPLPVVYVAYKIWFTGKICDIHIKYPIGMPQNIKDWDGFDKEVRMACESNSKNYLRPGDWISVAKPEMSPMEFHNMYERSKY